MKIIETREYFSLYRGDLETMPAKLIAEKYKVAYKVLAPDLPCREDRLAGVVKGRRLRGNQRFAEMAGGSDNYTVELLPAFEWRNSWMPTVLWAILRERPDLLVCFPAYTFGLKDYAVMIAKKLLGIPLVFRDAGQENFQQSIFKKMLYPVEKLVAKRCVDLVITYSGRGQKCWHDFYGIPYDSIEIVPKGVTLSDFSPNVDGQQFLEKLNCSGAFSVLFCSRLTASKGPDVILEAAGKLQGLGITDINYILVGEGEMRSQLEDYCKEHGLSGVYFTGMLPHGAVAQAYAAADIFVMPYSRDLRIAGFGTVVAEAMAMGKAIVIGMKGHEDAVPLKHMETAVFTGSGNADEVAEVILKLYRDSKLRSALGDNARSYVEQHMDWDAQADVYYGLYGDLVHRKRAGKAI